MASIFDTEEKQPIKTMDLIQAGFHYTYVNNRNIKRGHFYLSGYAPRTRQMTWVIRFYPKGHIFNEQKLRSNLLIYKDFQTDKTRKEIDDCIAKRRKANYTKGPLSQSKKMPQQGYYTKKYMRNIGKLEFDLVLSTVSNQFKNLK
jgi:hypothetical protein